MGRKSITGRVTPKGRHRIQFDLRIEGVRYRPSLRWVPSEANLRRARDSLRRIKAQIEAGIFRFSEEFPDYPLGKTGMRSCATRPRGSSAATWLRSR